MRQEFSKLLLWLACCLVALTLPATVWWARIVAHADAWGAGYFIFFVGHCLAPAVLVMIVLPSHVFHVLWKERRDRLTFRLGLGSLLAMIAEMLVLDLIPLKEALG